MIVLHHNNIINIPVGATSVRLEPGVNRGIASDLEGAIATLPIASTDGFPRVVVRPDPVAPLAEEYAQIHAAARENKEEQIKREYLASLSGSVHTPLNPPTQSARK